MLLIFDQEVVFNLPTYNVKMKESGYSGKLSNRFSLLPTEMIHKHRKNCPTLKKSPNFCKIADSSHPVANETS